MHHRVKKLNLLVQVGTVIYGLYIVKNLLSFFSNVNFYQGGNVFDLIALSVNSIVRKLQVIFKIHFWRG